MNVDLDAGYSQGCVRSTSGSETRASEDMAAPQKLEPNLQVQTDSWMQNMDEGRWAGQGVLAG